MLGLSNKNQMCSASRPLDKEGSADLGLKVNPTISFPTAPRQKYTFYIFRLLGGNTGRTMFAMLEFMKFKLQFCDSNRVYSKRGEGGRLTKP